MTKATYTTRTGTTQYRPVLTTNEFIHAKDTGFCLNCGDYIEGGVEPDARRYRCDRCEQPKVYGLQELLIMGLLTIEEQPNQQDENEVDDPRR